MANEKTFQSRIQLKHDVESHWQLATGFTPKAGEIIIYDADANNPVRYKIGDGTTNVNALPFATGTAVLYTSQTLTNEQKEQARANIGAISVADIPEVPVTSVAGKTGAVTLTKSDVGLGNVTNESKATMFTSPVFTGIPTAPTAENTADNTQVATTAFVHNVVGALSAADLGLEQAMKFLGTTTTDISDASNIDTIIIGSGTVKVEAGNVVLYNGYEYVWTGSAWEQLGQEGSFVLKSTTINGKALNNNITLTADDVDAYTKAEVDTALSSKSDTGHMHTTANITNLTATATELNYMSGVTSGVQAQIDEVKESIVQSDWYEYDETSPAYIKNSPYNTYIFDSDWTEVFNGNATFTQSGNYYVSEIEFTNFGAPATEAVYVTCDGVSHITEISCHIPKTTGFYQFNNYYLSISCYATAHSDGIRHWIRITSLKAIDTIPLILKVVLESNKPIGKIPSIFLTPNIARNDTVMQYVNPIGVGSLSIGRKADTTIGENSIAIGYNVEASGRYSHAEGYHSVATKTSSHAEGHITTASGWASHAEGQSTTASGDYSHAEGDNTFAEGIYSHAEGYKTAAYSDYQHVQGEYNIIDNAGAYAHIVGNGKDTRSNAHTLDWDGNAWFAGDVYVGSTSGTNKDEGSVKLATVAEMPTIEIVRW